MADKSFVFVFVKDRAYKSPTPYLLEYIRFKHPDEIRHKVICVKDAINFMLKELNEGDSIGNINVYSHSNNLGYVWGRLKTDDQYQGITHTNILHYQKTDKNVKLLSKFGTKNTFVNINGCNLGKSPEALRYWRDLFGGNKGKGKAPKLFQHYGLSTIELKATWGKKRKVFYKQEIRHTDDIAQYVKSAVAAAKQGKLKLHPEVEKILKNNALKDVNKWLMRKYLLLGAGGELPSDKQNLSEEQIKTFMQNILNEHGGIPATLLYNRLHPDTNRGDIRKVMKSKGAIFPEDRRWKLKFQIEIVP